jgi:hypothetical protein
MATDASTTALIQLRSITNGLVFLKDNSVRGVVQISAINFELRSSEEQEAIIQQFQGFLNAIDFPLQMLTQSRKFDIAAYLVGVEKASADLTNELLKVQAQEYIRFVRELSDLSNIMEKRFYVVLPVVVIAPPTEQKSGGMLGSLKGMFSKKKAGEPQAPTESPQQLELYAQQFQQRADLIISGLSGMGLKGKVLGQDELVALFNDLYNPRVPAEQQK